MISIHEKYNSWFRDYLEPRHPELVAPLRAALNAFDRIQGKQRVDHTDLEPILKTVRSQRRPLYENASSLLQSLTADHQAACDAVAELACDKKAHIRFNAILCLGRQTPRDLCVDLVRRALSDKSSRVRQKAADWAQRLGLSEIVPDLERVQSMESHPATKSTIDFSVRLLRDGYILDDKPGDNLSITVPTGSGITSRCVSRDEFESKGIEAIIADIEEWWPTIHPTTATEAPIS